MRDLDLFLSETFLSLIQHCMTAARTTPILELQGPKRSFVRHLKIKASRKRASALRKQYMLQGRENQAKVAPSQNM